MHQILHLQNLYKKTSQLLNIYPKLNEHHLIYFVFKKFIIFFLLGFHNVLDY